MVLKGENITISIHGDTSHVVSNYLRIFLTTRRLTEKQLEVATALVAKYTEYVSNNVVEPYASSLLFSTDVRKEICAKLNISPAHLNNTFNALTKKDILAKESGKYFINPTLRPHNKLIFDFKIDG